jgi:ABC-type bacteriocin/lantibiotic exporter with double-glycine peptidase domain
MGGIGSGKSTLAHLLLRLRNCDKGSILLNNVNIQEITLNSLRKNVHYVSQTPRLFNRTLWENISYGNGKLQVEKVYTLLQKLELYDLELVFRKKMHHSVGKHGSELSGGQRQIVLLMRALFNTDYRVLILDEPTSALDSHSRKQVIALIQWISKQSTVIVITHDEKLANYMDRKVWIQDGVVHE